MINNVKYTEIIKKATLSDEALKNICLFGVKKFEMFERSEFLNFKHKGVYFSLAAMTGLEFLVSVCRPMEKGKKFLLASLLATKP